MGEPTTKQLQQLFTQLLVRSRPHNDLPRPDSSPIITQPAAVITPSKQAQLLTNSHTPEKAEESIPGLEQEAQLEGLASSPDTSTTTTSSSSTTTTPGDSPEPLGDTISSFDTEDGPDLEYGSEPEDSLVKHPPPATMYRPRMAKEISAYSPGVFVKVTNTSGPKDCIKGKEDGCMTLQGFLDGLPVYYGTSLHQEILATQTKTILGLLCLKQPIESCFGKKQQAESAHEEAASSDSGCDTEDHAQKEPLATPLPPNRTYANQWFAVGKSPLGGFGVFAIVDIPVSTHILLEQPIFTSQYSNLERKYLRELNEEQKAVFDGLHGYSKNNPDPLHEKWNANHFYLDGSEGVFAIASNFNHACRSQRNTQYCWDSRRQVMTFTTTRIISKGDEILISYGTSRRHIYQNFGFVCHCGGCDGEDWEPMVYDIWDQF